jgi:TPR repeat protein
MHDVAPLYFRLERLLERPMKILFAGIAAWMLAGSVSTACAQEQVNDQCEKGVELQTALSYYDNNDYGRAATAFEQLATAGDACGQYWLAEMYHNGQGVPRNQDKYNDWLSRSAAQGYSKARIRLSLINQ